jgi:predicted DNA-binding transcriptional regulator AlpA
MQPAALSAAEAAQFLGVSERTLHNLRRSPDFPAPRVVGGRNRWLAFELVTYLESRPRAAPAAEPPQLARSTKRSLIAPKPETWPPPPGTTLRLRRSPSRQKAVAADDISRPA